MSTARGNFIDGCWIRGAGPPLASTDPASGAINWQGGAASESQFELAVRAARSAFKDWSQMPLEERAALLVRYADRLRAGKEEVADAICRETGKPRWEALTEVEAMAGKIAISIEAQRERRSPIEREQAGALAATRYKPMGVLAVFGPFNMPGHLPNGHIVPALLAGNTVVFKPSELTPLVGQKMAEILEEAGAPAGVINVVQGGRDVGGALAGQPGIDGVLFTGSVAGGLAIRRALVDQPGKILALEMGGNNPLIVWDAKGLDAAAFLTIQSAFITSGQRCSCARRLIVPDNSAGQAFVDRLAAMMAKIQVGPYTRRPEPFMGPVISTQAAEGLIAAQLDLMERGAADLVPMFSIGGCRAMLSPGLIDVTNVPNRADAELFGPLLQVIRVADFDAALAEANRTSFGLAAGLFSDDADLWRRFQQEIRAGVIYRNRQTTGGSSQLPFGGTGQSGNFRPSGYWAADYCSYPVASIEKNMLDIPKQRPPGIRP
ncbi:MAG TPA: succinylglutamate-semialdehyde dehydrogenase [Tepidisphaeraceae bacterium]|nr:succinylglutamate-semialdehyde dehydrogenase [Tepidisphaeraceae bacterium]